MTVRLVLAGCGAWGKNLLRALVQDRRARVIAVADPNPARLAVACSIAPGAALLSLFEQALELRPDAVVIATPPHTHAALVLTALDAGADVFVEKPLAVHPLEAEQCVAAAAASGRIAMVGHLLRYHPAVAHLIALARERELGTLRHFAAARLLSRGSHPLWTMGPHDMSVLHALDQGPIASFDTQWSDDSDRVALTMRLESGMTAKLDLARSNPTKERRLSIVGSSRIALFDDVRAPDRIVLGEADGGREGPAVVDEIRVPWREPLALEVEHFIRCVEQRARPLTPFEEGAVVVRMLAQAEAVSVHATGTASARSSV